MPADASSTASRGLPQMVTVAALLLGLIAMHNLGHQGGHTVTHSPGPAGAIHHVDVSPASDALPLFSAYPGAPDPDDGDLVPVMICLAVLAGLGLAVLFAAALSRRRTWVWSPSVTPVSAPPWPRPPPQLAPLLSELSILRI